MCIRDSIRAARVEGGVLVVAVAGAIVVESAEHLRRRSLVEPRGVGHAGNAYGFEHPQNALASDISRELGIAERIADVTDCSEVVDLVGTRSLDSPDQRGLIHEVGLDQLHIRELVGECLAAGIALTAQQSIDLVALAMEKFGEVAAVLTGDSGDEGAFLLGHVNRIPSLLCEVSILVLPAWAFLAGVVGGCGLDEPQLY